MVIYKTSNKYCTFYYCYEMSITLLHPTLVNIQCATH